MLQLKNVSKSFGDVQAVSNLSLEIQQQEIFVLLGPTGAGKTTTLKMAAGLIKPDAGQVFISEKDVTEIPPAFRDISFVFESYNLFHIYNVYDNIAFALKSKLLRVEKAEIDKRVQAFSRDLHIEHLLDRPTGTLSGGETQRVALARALVRKASLNLFDEPLSNLDLKLREELRVEFKELHKKYHSTIFYVTHDHDSAVSVADRIGIIYGGILYQIDTPDNLIENPNHITVATLINYPTINILDCSLEDHSLQVNHQLPLVELTSPELDKIRAQTSEKEFQVGLKLKSVKLGKEPGNLNFSGKHLHTEYQGYNKVVNIDFEGLTIRLITIEAVDLDFGEQINFNFSPKDIFLFSKSSGKRILK
jgi:multiple sugar transport system ATP-binding protein